MKLTVLVKLQNNNNSFRFKTFEGIYQLYTECSATHHEILNQESSQSPHHMTEKSSILVSKHEIYHRNYQLIAKCIAERWITGEVH
jgi:hypothetical protein